MICYWFAFGLPNWLSAHSLKAVFLSVLIHGKFSSHSFLNSHTSVLIAKLQKNSRDPDEASAIFSFYQHKCLPFEGEEITVRVYAASAQRDSLSTESYDRGEQKESGPKDASFFFFTRRLVRCLVKKKHIWGNCDLDD